MEFISKNSQKHPESIPQNSTAFFQAICKKVQIILYYMFLVYKAE